MADVSTGCKEYDFLASERGRLLASLYNPAIDPYLAALQEFHLTEFNRLIGVHDRRCANCARPEAVGVVE